MKTYREEVLRTYPIEYEPDMLINGGLGLAAEAGEVCNLIKKQAFQHQEIHRNALIDELGDVCWYIEILCHALNVSTEEVKIKNIEKLRKRYPEGAPNE